MSDIARPDWRWVIRGMILTLVICLLLIQLFPRNLRRKGFLACHCAEWRLMGQLLVASLERAGALETSRDERGRGCDDRRAVSCGVSSADCLESVSGLRRFNCRLGNPVFYLRPSRNAEQHAAHGLGRQSLFIVPLWGHACAALCTRAHVGHSANQSAVSRPCVKV